MTDAAIRSKVDGLLAAMTPAEKAGQLTQYFFFGFEPDPNAVPGVEQDNDQGSQLAAVEAAMARGEVGSLLFQTDPAEINRLQRLTIEGNRLGIPALFGYDGGALGGRDYDEVNLLGPEDTSTVSVEVTNTGDREADDVVQLYIHQRYGTASRPVRELKGFRRISLAAGESRTLEFPLGPAERRYWNAVARDWVLDASTFDVWAGGDSAAELGTTFEVAKG